MNRTSAFRLSIRSKAAFALLLGSLAGTAAFAQSANDISAEVQQQISSILAMKRTFTPAEQKMSSNLVFQSRAAAGRSIGAAASLIKPATASEIIAVDIGGTISPKLLEQITANGGTVESAAPGYGIMRASLPLQSLPLLAAHPDVKWIREPDPSRTNVGALTSQGYISHRANLVTPVTGAGVKVGVLSDSATAARVTALMTSGDLGPTTTVLPGQDGTGADEGAAMMEVIQDMAPGAQIFFATANSGQAQFAANITALGAAGCTIIVDDVSYFAEPAFQDGPIAQAINTFVAGGGIYFSAASDNGNLTNATSGTWEGDFLNGGAVTGPIATAGETGSFHNFGTAGSPQNYDVLTGLSTIFTLKWSDPLGGSTNDYDLFLLNSAGTTLKAFSAAVQNGAQDPYEEIQLAGTTIGDRLVVVLFSGNARALRLASSRGRFSIGTSGATFGHNAAASTQTIAAAYWNSKRTGTQPFSSADLTEVFSSDGPRKIFYNPNGTPITPGNLLFATNGGTTLQKPDFTAADGVVVKTPGFLPYFGTSAAAAHAAGIAALIKSAKPTLTGAQIRTLLSTTAIDVMAPGTDRDSGIGAIDAKAAVDAALALP